MSIMCFDKEPGGIRLELAQAFILDILLLAEGYRGKGENKEMRGHLIKKTIFFPVPVLPAGSFSGYGPGCFAVFHLPFQR